ncbi:hypothetical protein ACFX1X_020128 [Malus domestica]
MLDTEPAHCTLRARDSLTANSSDRLESSLLSLGVTRFRATTAAVISFFITESPTVRGPVGDMKDGCHMLSGEDGTTSSSRFKSKRRSEGPDIFKVLKEEEIGQIKILEVQEGSFHKQKFKCALKRTACLYKKSALDGISEDRRGELRIRRGHSKIKEASSEIGEASCFSRRVGTRHMQTQLCENHGQFVEAPIRDIEEAPVFFSHVSTHHTQTQL